MNWSKKKCVEYIQQMKSPIEEINKGNGNGAVPSVIERLRSLGSKKQEGR